MAVQSCLGEMGRVQMRLIFEFTSEPWAENTQATPVSQCMQDIRTRTSGLVTSEFLSDLKTGPSHDLILASQTL